MNTPDIEKFITELKAFKKARTTTVMEIRLDLPFAIAAQSQIIYNQQKDKNLDVANKALEAGVVMQLMFRIDLETYEILAIRWELPESEIYKMLEIANR